MAKDLNKIIRTLALSASDTREETLKSIVLNTLFENEESADIVGIEEAVNIIYDLDLYRTELKEILSNLYMT